MIGLTIPDMSAKSWRGVMFGAAAGDPTAPVFPSETGDPTNTPELQRQNNHPGPYNPSANFPTEDPESGTDNPQEENSNHVFFAVELIIFALIGWGWLAVREYMGRTPVLDVVSVISVMICTLINLVLALITPSQLEFAPCARAYFTHCLALWIFYIYSLSESMRLDTGAMCCVDGSGNQGNTYSAGPTHAAAFFGGLPMHQVPGVVSVAYLSVILLIAGAQARACKPRPKDWVVRGLGLSITSMTAMHLAAYLLGVPMCDKDQMWGILSILVGIGAVFFILDLDWIMNMVYTFVFRRGRSVQERRDHRLIRGVIQTAGVGFLLFFCLIVAMVMEMSLSIPLLVVTIVCVIVSFMGLGYDAVILYGSDVLGIKAWEPQPEFSGRNQSTRTQSGVHPPPFMTRSRSLDSRGVDSIQGHFLRRYPMFLQGQLNRGKKSY